MAAKNQKKDEKPFGFVVFVDEFMSGWGPAKEGRALYALEVASKEEAETVLANGAARSEMRSGRFSRSLPSLRAGDVLSVADRRSAGRWYVRGAFKKEGSR